MRASPVDPVIVVLGHAAEQVRAAVDLRGAIVVHNPDHATGQASSLRTGLSHVPGAAEAAVVALGDQPGVTPAVVEALVAAYRRDRRPLTAATYGGRRGNPVLIARDLFARAMRLDGDVGARVIMEEQPGWVAEVPADGLADPRDVDTVEDLHTLERGGPT